MKSSWIFTLILIYVFTYAIGQFLLKYGLDHGTKRKQFMFISSGVASMTVSFFLNIGLLEKLDLSYLYPFQGLNVLFIVFGGFFFLKEHLSPALITGALLIAAGVMMVSAT